MDEEVYVCQACGHEDHPDRFGKLCPGCGVDLDELESELSELASVTPDQCGGNQGRPGNS